MSWVPIVSLFLGGVFDAAMDTLQFSYHHSVFSTWNPKFWDPEISWMNKHEAVPGKPGSIYPNTSRFFGSTTFLVWLTDGWHLFKFCRNTCIALSIIFFPGIHHSFEGLAIYFLAARFVWGVGFSIAYKVL